MSTIVSPIEFHAHTDDTIGNMMETGTIVTVAHPDGRDFVLAPGSEWRSMVESAYLTSTTNNRIALAQSLKEADQGATVDVDL